MKPISIYNFTLCQNAKIQMQIPETLQSYLSDLDLKKGTKNKIYLFASFILYQNRINKIDGDWTVIHSLTLKKILGSRYKKFLSQIQELQIVQVNNQYLTSKEHFQNACSKKYRLYARFLDSPIITVTIIDKKIYRRLLKLHRAQANSKNISYKQYKQGIKNITDYFFSNKKLDAYDFIDTNQNEREEIPRSIIVSDSDPKYKNLYKCLNEITFDVQAAREYIFHSRCDHTDKEINQMNYTCDYFLLNMPRLIKQQRSGRITSVITNMNKELRQFIRLNNEEELIMLDVSNFQPYILNLFIKKLGLENKQDSIQWLNLTAKGQIYEQLQDIYNAVYPDKRKKSRMQIKKELVSILNGPIKENNYFKDTRTDLYLLLEDLFPSVIQTLNEMKKNDYKDMSFLLQGAEARLMIDSIACKFAKENFILTIHDAVVIQRKDLKKFRRLFRSVFRKYLSVLPKLKLTGLDGEAISKRKEKKQEITTKQISEAKTETINENILLKDILKREWK